MMKIRIPSNKNQKLQKRPGEVGKSVFVFKYFQTDDYAYTACRQVVMKRITCITEVVGLKICEDTYTFPDVIQTSL